MKQCNKMKSQVDEWNRTDGDGLQQLPECRPKEDKYQKPEEARLLRKNKVEAIGTDRRRILPPWGPKDSLSTRERITWNRADGPWAGRSLKRIKGIPLSSSRLGIVTRTSVFNKRQLAKKAANHLPLPSSAILAPEKFLLPRLAPLSPGTNVRIPRIQMNLAS